MPITSRRREAAFACVAFLLACSHGGGKSSSGDGGASSGDGGTSAIESIAVSPGAASLTLGATLLFTAVATDASGGAVAARLTWSSSDPATLTIDAGGMAVARAAGSATVRAAAGSVQSAPVTVSTAPLTGVASVTLSPTAIDVNLNQPGRIKAQAVDANGKAVSLAVRQVAWSSSDPSVATVGAGVVMGKAAGTATVVASVAGIQSAPVTVTVHDLHVESGGTAKTSEGKIADALTAGAITSEQALLYRLFDDYGSPELPAQYRGEIAGNWEGRTRLAIGQAWPTLSAQAQARALPYLTPPIYPGSWGDPAFLTGPARSARGDLQTAYMPICVTGNQDVPPGWGLKVTAHFNFWYRTVIRDPLDLIGSYTAEEAELAADNLASHAEEIWSAETGYMGRFPLSDASLACNGDGGAQDVYVDRRAWSRGAATEGFDGQCKGTPAWIWVAPDIALTDKDARDVFAHEFLHAIQYGYQRPGACEEYAWLDEASANWAIDYLYHDDQFEQDSAYRYFCDDENYPIGHYNPDDQYNNPQDGYEDYVFLQYVENQVAKNTVKSMLDFTQATDSLDAVANAVGAVSSGLDDVWPKFALQTWNDVTPGGTLHWFQDYDKLPWGVHFCMNPSPDRITLVHPVEVKLGSSPDRIDNLGEGGHNQFLIKLFGGTQIASMIPYMSIDVIDLKFTDDTVRSLVVENKPVALTGYYPKLRIQAMKKISGSWKAPEDWTHEPFKTFCRDKADERLEELVLFYSNSSIDPAKNVNLLPNGPDAPDNQKFETWLDVSNAGCWKWQGTARVTSNSVGVATVTELVTADVTMERDRSQVPAGVDVVGHDVYKPTAGTVTYSESGTLSAGCTISVPSTSHAIGRDDGYIDLTFDQPKQPFDRQALAHGGTTVQVTQTIQCPTGTQTANTSLIATWLTAPGGPLTLSADGQKLSGNVTLTDPSGSTQQYQWDLTAQRE